MTYCQQTGVAKVSQKLSLRFFPSAESGLRPPDNLRDRDAGGIEDEGVVLLLEDVDAVQFAVATEVTTYPLGGGSLDCLQTLERARFYRPVLLVCLNALRANSWADIQEDVECLGEKVESCSAANHNVFGSLNCRHERAVKGSITGVGVFFRPEVELMQRHAVFFGGFTAELANINSPKAECFS